MGLVYTCCLVFWLWKCQCTYARTRPGGLLSVSSRCFRHWSEHRDSMYFLYDFSLLRGLAKVMFCGREETGSGWARSTWQITVCMRYSSVSKGTTCSRGYHRLPLSRSSGTLRPLRTGTHRKSSNLKICGCVPSRKHGKSMSVCHTWHFGRDPNKGAWEQQRLESSSTVRPSAFWISACVWPSTCDNSGHVTSCRPSWLLYDSRGARGTPVEWKGLAATSQSLSLISSMPHPEVCK